MEVTFVSTGSSKSYGKVMMRLLKKSKHFSVVIKLICLPYLEFVCLIRRCNSEIIYNCMHAQAFDSLFIAMVN